MAKQLINQVKCQHCGKMFDVNTEDIEWEHVKDLGEDDTHAPLHDYSLIQKMRCPNPECREVNTIVYGAIGDLQKGYIPNQGVTAI